MPRPTRQLATLSRAVSLVALAAAGVLAVIGSGGGGGGTTCSGIFDVVNGFSFTPVTNAALDTAVVSNTAAIEGFCSQKEITISGDGDYSINGGPFTRQPGLIGPNSKLRVRIISAPTFGTRRAARVAIGDHLLDPVVSFSVTTRPGDAGMAPTVQILSPVDQQVVDSASLLVTGLASDPDGVASVVVNGVPATSADGFATWQAQIPLATGSNAITVAASDSLLNTNPTAAQISVQNQAIVLAEPVDIVVDDGNGRILVLDEQLRALVSIDIATGDSTLISGDSRPDGQAPFMEPTRMGVSAAADRAWVVDNAYDDLIAVDLLTGSRALLVDTVSPSPSESLRQGRDIALDEISDQALVLVGGLNSAVNDTRIVAVDLGSGERSILSDASTPNGENPLERMFGGVSEVFDAAGFRLIVSQSGNVLAVDPLTGNRDVFSEIGIDSPIDSTLDLLNNRVIVLNRFSSLLYGVDLNTGEVEFLWPVIGGFNPLRAAFDPTGNRTLVLFTSSNNIFAVDMATGQNSVAY